MHITRKLGIRAYNRNILRKIKQETSVNQEKYCRYTVLYDRNQGSVARNKAINTNAESKMRLDNEALPTYLFFHNIKTLLIDILLKKQLLNLKPVNAGHHVLRFVNMKQD